MSASVSLLESAGGQRKPLKPDRPLTRIRARLFHSSLDRALATGTDPASSPALARRAARLTSRRNRERLGRSLARILCDSRAAVLAPSSRIMPNRAEVERASGELQRIGALLASATPVYVGGVARLERLITNGVGPFYSPAYRGHLLDELGGLALALEGRQERW